MVGLVLRHSSFRVPGADVRLDPGFRPCLILLDLWMPIMSEWDFRREHLKDVLAKRRCPICPGSDR
jgi:hypothetical protein